MRQSRALLLMAVVVMLSAGGMQAFGHGGHSHKAMGIVKVVDATHIEVDTEDEGKLSIGLDEETKYVKGDKPASRADVKVGARAVVTFVEKGGKGVAQEVRVAVEK